MPLDLYNRRPSIQQDPRGFGLAPNFSGPVAQTGTVYNPSGAAGAIPMNRGGSQQPAPTGPGVSFQGPNPFTRPGVHGSTPISRPGSGNPFLDAINSQLGGSTTPQGGAYGGTNIQTSITPGPIYSPQQTNEAVNQSIANNTMPLPWLQGRFAGGGTSVNSPGVISRAMVPYGQGIAAGQTAAANIPLQDTQADAQHILAGQQGREGEAIDWARLFSAGNNAEQGFRMNSLASILSLLGSFA